MTKDATSLKVAQGRETVQRLLSIARHAFAVHGYSGTTTQDIIAIANVTKGALYHHFPSKTHLFEAVYRTVENEIAQRIGAASDKVRDPWEKLVQGCFAYMRACQNPGIQRILRVDGPAVLGLETWSRIDREYGIDRLLPYLQYLSQSNLINVPSVEAFAWQLTGAMNEATFWIVQHKYPKRALKQSEEVLLLMLQGARADSS